ncbi:ribulose bisphosphate carboxylase/oxygenase activase, chloroplastic-like [Telopea speciosissima]|uniref:ribulose bisphosphate carboxylase/oxygenase activase, chloroplastic-like n=1 Tax=Telopea speciosissima TaxID=54955 RepID=UPI001CC5094A|nr:ribulose bisphosphate carboxylase/oxygenase activase, chloroplastic-like [Telopea speciosissima]
MSALFNCSPELVFSNLSFQSYNSSLKFPITANLLFLSSKKNSASTLFCSRRTHEESSAGDEETNQSRRLSEQSSWEAKDSEGRDYLYRLGKEADNMNIAVGARAGIIDDLFVGDFLGRDSDIVFDYRQKVTRSFEYLQGDYYIAPIFMEKVVCHIVKNYIAHVLNTKVPLILGIWGGKGQGKSFQTELIFQAMGIEPVIMSAGELESEKAGEPGKLIRERYRTASQVVQNQGKVSCLMINDIDAGLGRFGNTQMTVNNQIVVGTLMNLADNPTRVSIGQDWRESDVTHRIPVIVTGNDFSVIYAPLIRDGRMEKFYWLPTHEDIVNIVHKMYAKDGISRDEVVGIVNTFPNQGLSFSCTGCRDLIHFCILRSRNLVRKLCSKHLPLSPKPYEVIVNHTSFYFIARSNRCRTAELAPWCSSSGFSVPYLFSKFGPIWDFLL